VSEISDLASEMMVTKINCWRSKQTVIQVKVKTDVRNLLSLSFSKKDGSIFVSFPYFSHTSGVLSVVTLEKGEHTDVQVNLGQSGRGKCTSHLVKYAHHPDGEAHFSQAGKVFTHIRRRSVPLKSVRGHIFTAYAQGLHGFSAANRSKDLAGPSHRRVNLTFDLGDQAPGAIKIVARLYQASLFANMLVGAIPESMGPIIPLRDDNGSPMNGFCIGNPYDTADQTAVVITCLPIPRLNPTREMVMMFIGGFDPLEQAATPDQPTSFLALQYPADNFDELRAMLGSVDIDWNVGT
jgi:hypothetical protein